MPVMYTLSYTIQVISYTYSYSSCFSCSDSNHVGLYALVSNCYFYHFGIVIHVCRCIVWCFALLFVRCNFFLVSLSFFLLNFNKHSKTLFLVAFVFQSHTAHIALGYSRIDHRYKLYADVCIIVHMSTCFINQTIHACNLFNSMETNRERVTYFVVYLHVCTSVYACMRHLYGPTAILMFVCVYT